MREQLIQYVNLLFAGNNGVEDIKQEILQNTLDRYDDLVAQGKSPEAAYRLAISGIGDINEILGGTYAQATPDFQSIPAYRVDPEEEPVLNSIMRAVAIGMYIISIIPLIVLDRFGLAEIGLCGTLLIVAAATVILILFKKKGETPDSPARSADPGSPSSELKTSVRKLISALGLAVYLILSFLTGAWFITWLVFPITAAVQGLVNACIDLKEELS